MTAKEKQSEFIKEYLKPLLKKHDYCIQGQTWWKDKGDFFIVANLQNYSWNSKESVDFCFNVGIALAKTLNDTLKKRPTVHDLTVYLREGAYLPADRKTHQFRNHNGYFINSSTAVNDFAFEFKKDFEEIILPQLEALKTLSDCLKYFEGVPFWSDQLKKAVEENDLL